MSEFKFACPVCGQHLTADASASGSRLDCPTCFRQLIVPQAPASPDSKLILSAAEAPRARNAQPESKSRPGQGASQWRVSVPFLAMALVILLGTALAWRFWGNTALDLLYPNPQPDPAEGMSQTRAPAQYPVPQDVPWTLDVTNARLPQIPAAGSIRGRGFRCERAVLNGRTLSLRQGAGWPPELAVTVALEPVPGNDFSRRTIVIPSTRPAPSPRVTLRWLDPHRQPRAEHFESGYALKIVFGQAANDIIPGRIYVALPDSAKSFVAGNFEAEVRTRRGRD